MSATSDAAARAHAVDPARNVVLEASAGTGKTRVLVERYVNLLRAGVDPDHILAITFTRKAAAEMRERIVDRLREASRLSEFDRGRWRDLKDRLGEIAVSTIDAFCLSLLREFPLEADVDPGFELADETEVPRLIDESLDASLRICRSIAATDDDVALVFAQLGERRLRAGLASLLDRRLVAPPALSRYLSNGPRDLTAATVCRRAAQRLRDAFTSVPGGLEQFLADGPAGDPAFTMLADDTRRLADSDARQLETRQGQAAFRVLADRLRAYFVKSDGEPRGEGFAGTGFSADDCASTAAWKRHRTAAAAVAPGITETLRAFRRDLNVVLSHGVWRIFAVALSQFQRTLDSRALLDFPGVLERAIELLKEMDEFAQSRFRLESRYRHVLVDEFQDTSRAQWQLVARLVRNWGEGLGAASDALPPSIFIVGDRKQSIYGFRDADVAVLDEAAAFVSELRADDHPRRAISVSYRSVPQILSFINDVFAEVEQTQGRSDRFRWDETDRFPIDPAPDTKGESPRSGDQGLLPFGDESGASDVSPVEPSLGLVAGDSIITTAALVAAEISCLVGRAIVRDRLTGMRRPAQPSDIAVLFRSRDTHREFEKALERRGVSTYVYKGLGFFDADEVQDVVSLLRYLAEPESNIRAAALLRSGVVRLSDRGLCRLAPDLARALTCSEPPAAAGLLSDEDRAVLETVRAALPRWLGLVDRLAPSELVADLLDETAYAFELEGPRYRQARENLKKLRAIIRRFQNRGYATLARVVAHLERLAVNDESNAAIDAQDAVSLMTVHASKGLEFPVVFLVNMGRGTGTTRAPIRVAADVRGEPSVAIADFQSEADDDAVARDREETKRLLYVALTRARDRLYLSGVATGGAPLRATRGALGEVLPDSVKRLFGQTGSGSLEWQGSSGTVHTFTVRTPAARAIDSA
jgi:ATP-dependent helicase/nuclease subunit A